MRRASRELYERQRRLNELLLHERVVPAREIRSFECQQVDAGRPIDEHELNGAHSGGAQLGQFAPREVRERAVAVDKVSEEKSDVCEARCKCGGDTLGPCGTQSSRCKQRRSAGWVSKICACSDGISGRAVACESHHAARCLV